MHFLHVHMSYVQLAYCTEFSSTTVRQNPFSILFAQDELMVAKNTWPNALVPIRSGQSMTL